MSNNQDNKKGASSFDVSRRSFLKGTVAATMGALAVGAGGSILSGCQPAEQRGSSLNPTSNGSFEVYDADILVIGCGLSGAQAVLAAVDQGTNVMVVDKGPFQFSGAAGFNWDILLGYSPDGLAYEAGVSGSYDLRNNTIYDAMVEFENEVPNTMVTYAEQGGTTFHRDSEGKVFWYTDTPEYMRTDEGFMRYATDCVRDYGVSVYDQTLITDLIIEDDICRGAVGVHIPTGSFRAFRAKAVIKTTGGSTQTYGWVSVSPISLNSPDNTGDLDAAAYRHGCELMDNEFYKWDLITLYPEGIAGAYNSGIGADVTDYKHVSDSDGNYFLKDIPESEMERNRFTQEVAKKIYEGKVGPNGGVFIDMSEEVVKMLRPSYSRNVALWKDVFDLDVTKEKLEVGMECFEHGGVPRVDEKLMTAIPGFFDVRGGGTAGEEGALSGFRSYRQAPYATKNAVAYANDLEVEDSNINWIPVETEIERLLEIKNGTPENGLRPHEIRHLIQAACFRGLGPIRDAANLNTCIAELERIQAEDLPNQYVMNKTLVFNNEWKDAIENHNLIIIGLAAAKASLMREESRGEMARSDFPEADAYWSTVNIVAKQNGDEMVLEATRVGAMPKQI